MLTKPFELLVIDIDRWVGFGLEDFLALPTAQGSSSPVIDCTGRIVWQDLGVFQAYEIVGRCVVELILEICIDHIVRGCDAFGE